MRCACIEQGSHAACPVCSAASGQWEARICGTELNKEVPAHLNALALKYRAHGGCVAARCPGSGRAPWIRFWKRCVWGRGLKEKKDKDGQGGGADGILWEDCMSKVKSRRAGGQEPEKRWGGRGQKWPPGLGCQAEGSGFDVTGATRITEQ